MATELEIQDYLSANFHVINEIEPFHKPQIIESLNEIGLDTVKVSINTDDFERYLLETNSIYPETYKQAFGTYFKRKALEHFCSFQLLKIESTDIYMDVASSGSAVPAILKDYFQLKTVWKQDIRYPEGIDVENKIIGSNAASIPLESESIDKIALHCSFEHFEKGADIGFIKELGRILKAGGKACILPLYMNKKHHILSNLELITKLGIPGFDKEVPVYIQDRPNNHFGRFYDASALKHRVIDSAKSIGLEIDIVDLSFTNPKDYGIGTNLSLVLTRP